MPLSNFGLFRTNVKLSGNIKLTTDSSGKLYLNSINANPQLADSRFKKYGINPNNKLSQDIYRFLNYGGLSSNLVYDIYRTSDDVTLKSDYSKHFEQQYTYGASRTDSSLYPEAYSFFAPFWLTNKIPKYFVIFRNKGAKITPYEQNPASLNIDRQYRVVGDADFEVRYGSTLYHNGDSFVTTTIDGGGYTIITGEGYVVENDPDHEYERLSNENNIIEDFISPSDIVAIYDLSETTNLGKYLRNHLNDSLFNEDSTFVNFDNKSITYNGIDINTGVLTTKIESISDLLDVELDIIDFDEHITRGFERNRLVSSNLINLEFLFDDPKSSSYTFNRYFGFYCDDLDIGSFFVDKKNMFSLQGLYRNVYWDKESLPLNYNSKIEDSSGVKIIPDLVTASGHVIEKSVINTTPSFYYIKDKYGDIHKLNNVATSTNYVLDETTLDSEKIFRFDDHIEVEGISLKTAGKSSLTLTVNDEVYTSYRIQILYRGTSIGYVIADHLPNVTEPYGSGDNIGYYFYPTGTTEEIAQGLTGAIDYLLADYLIDAVNIGNQVILINKSVGAENDQYSVNLIGDTGQITPNNEYFSGGTRTTICRIKVDADLPSSVTTDSFILTDRGYCKIKSIAAYLDEPIYDSSGEVSGFTGLNQYKVINIVDENQKILLKSRQIAIYNDAPLKIGVLSLYDIKDFDFNFNQSAYNKSYSNEYKKYFNTAVDKLIVGDFYQVFKLSNDPISPYIIPDGYEISSIISVNTATNTIVVTTDVTTQFPAASLLGITNSTGNDGIYDVVSSTYDIANDITTIILVQQFFDQTVDGDISIPLTEGEQFEALESTYQILEGNPITINTKYYIDDELKKFIGFNTLLDDSVLSRSGLDPDDLINKEYLFSLNENISEYDRLKELSKSTNALKSKVVPFVNKWVLKDGLNIRDVEYRLNLSKAFNELNFSPSFADEIQNPRYFTHEWLYLSAVPEKISNDDLIKSTAYFTKKFEPLRLVDTENDYFSQYFTIDEFAIRSETIPNQFDLIEVPTQQRYSTFSKMPDGSYETFFRGVRIKLRSDYDLTDYKFAAILNINKTEAFDGEQPVKISIVENKDFANITLVVDITADDYKILPNLSLDPAGEYTFLYVMKSLRRWFNPLGAIANINQSSRIISVTGEFVLYKDDKITINGGGSNDGFYTVESASYDYNTNTTDITVVEAVPSPIVVGNCATYQYGLEFDYSDLSAIAVDLYKTYGAGFPVGSPVTTFRGYQLYNKLVFNNLPNIQTMKFDNSKFLLQQTLKVNGDGKFGRLIGMNQLNALFVTADPVFYNTSSYIIDTDSRIISVGSSRENEILLEPSGIAVANIPFLFAVGNYDPITLHGSVYSLSGVTWFHEFGGLNVYQDVARLISFGSISNLIDDGSNLVEYSKIENGVQISGTDFQFQLLKPSRVDLKDTLTVQKQNITLPELPSENAIDYLNVRTGMPISMFRYNGKFDPKFKDVIFFKNDRLVMSWGLYTRAWEDVNHTWEEYQSNVVTINWVNVTTSWNNNNSTWDTMDANNINQNVVPPSTILYGLNTKFDTSIEDFGIIDDYYHHKTSNIPNLLALTNPIYESIGEIAIDKFDFNVFSSDWDAKFYKQYTDKVNFNEVFGTLNMVDVKSFMGTKLLQIENLINISEFDSPIQDTGIDLRSYSMGTNQLVYEIRNNVVVFRVSLTNVLLKYISSRTIDEFKRWVNEFNTTELDHELALESYIRSNIIPFFSISSVTPYIKKYNEGSFPIIANEPNELILLANGYRVDKNVSTENVNKLEVIIRYNTQNNSNYSFNLTFKLES